MAPSFSTRDPEEVAAFARSWGFIETRSIILDTLGQVRDFANEVERAGQWEGEAVEGFVVRCKIAPEPSSSSDAEPVSLAGLQLGDTKPSDPSSSARSSRPPYPPGSTFFFKIKFDQPYLLYRNFREITKFLLPILDTTPQGKAKAAKLQLSSFKLSNPESVLYERWCRRTMVSDPQLFAGIPSGKGIIRCREIFLDWLASDEGKAELERERAIFAAGPRRKDWKTDDSMAVSKEARGKDGWGKTLLVPIAIPGCGASPAFLLCSALWLNARWSPQARHRSLWPCPTCSASLIRRTTTSRPKRPPLGSSGTWGMR